MDIQAFHMYQQEINLEGDLTQYKYQLNFFAESRMELLNGLNKEERAEALLPYKGSIAAYIMGEAQTSRLRDQIFYQRDLNRLKAGRPLV